MSRADFEYNSLLNNVLDNGKRKKNRTGVDTWGVFGAQARFNLADGFPLLTTKKMFFKGIVHELLWFIRGDTNIKYLVDNGVNIWNGNAFDRYQKERPKRGGLLLPDEVLLTDEEKQFRNSASTDPHIVSIRALAIRKEELFINHIRENAEFAKEWGDLGEGTYGGMWRAFPYYDPSGQITLDGKKAIGKLQHVDQLQKAVDKLNNSPDDRRIIVSAWHPYWVDHCALPPCHVLFHFNTEELAFEERQEIFLQRHEFLLSTDTSEESLTALFDGDGIPKRRLNCLLYQRSCDLFLGVPFNIASYALLTSMVAHCVNMVPGTFIHTFGDLHLYETHLKAATKQLLRTGFESPSLHLNPNVTSLFDFKFEDITLSNYESCSPIKVEMAV